MANSYFQFKQFTIHQNQCAMKVSTEACILGGWVSATKPNRILDIGTGSGLLALMLAQRIEAPIDAIEMDEGAANQAGQNVNESEWANRIQVINDDVFEWLNTTEKRYDLIVSNPPFFTNSLKSDATKKNLAKHDTSKFNKENLACALKSLLSVNGEAYILYPELESQRFKEEVEKIGLFYAEALIIRNQPNGSVFRIISRISIRPLREKGQTLNIRIGNIHSQEFNDLLKPYYLKF